MEDGVYIVNQQYNIEFVNSALKKEFGDYVGKKCYAYFHNRINVCPWCKNQEVWKGKTVRWEWISPKNNKTYDIIDTPLIDSEGNISKLEIFRDITGKKKAEEVLHNFNLELKKKAEETLKESERSLKNTQKTAHIGDWSWDLKINKIKWSEENYRIFGLPANVVPSYEAFEKTIHPDDLDFVNNSVQDALQRKKLYNIDFRIITPSNEVRIVNAVGEVVYENNKPRKFFGTVQDITKRKKVEEALKESEEKYRSLFENANDAIFIADIKTGITLDANKKAELLLGRSKKEIIGMNQSEMHPQDKKEYYKKYFKNHIKEENVTDSEADIIKKDGTIFPVSISASIIKLNGKKVIQGIFRDITERKKAEKKLRESEERASAILNSSNEAIFLIDRSGKILMLNDVLPNMLKKPKKEFVGFNIYDLPPKELANVRKAKTEEVFNSKKPLRFQEESNGLCFDNTTYPVLNEKNEVIAAAIYSRDITKMKKIEKEKEKLQEKLKEYAKRLEIKVKELEKNNINLTDKEKLVFWGMTKHPSYNDQELSKTLKVKRSTITSIRNRLKKEDMYATLNIPNFKKLGAKLITLTYGRFNIPYEKRKELINKENLTIIEPNMMIHSDNEFVDLVVSENTTEFERNNAQTYHQLNKYGIIKKSQTAQFFLELKNIRRFLDYSNILKHLFEIKIKEKAEEEEEEEEIKLNKNEKIVLLKMIEHPEASAYDLSFKTDLTRITCAKIKNKFLKEKIVKTIIIPNIQKLGVELITLNYLKLDYGMTKETINDLLEKNPHIIFMIDSGREAMWINVFKNYKEHSEDLNKTLNSQQELDERLTTLKILTKDIKIEKIEFLNTTKKILGEPK